MKFSQKQYEEKFKLMETLTHDVNIKIIFQWVKDGKIGPKQMEELIIESYKVHVDF